MSRTPERQTICFDVDKTLVFPYKEGSKDPYISITDPYSGKKVFRHVHFPHARLLYNYVKRGADVVVWSKNGRAWAKAVLKAMKLDKLIHPMNIKTKPFSYVDDYPCESWMGERTFIPFDDSFGNEIKPARRKLK